MPFSLKYIPTRDLLYIQANGQSDPYDYRKVMTWISKKEELNQAKRVSNYQFVVQGSLFSEWETNFDEITTYTQTKYFINHQGKQEENTPIIQSIAKHMDETKIPLYDFQKDGVNFLLSVKCGLIGDEMGLGKTPQTMVAAMELIKEGKAKKCLVICPNIVKEQWVEEIRKFTDMTSISVSGILKKRLEIYQDFVTSENIDFLVMSYENMRNDCEKFEFKAVIGSIQIVIADEVHRVKNQDSKTFKEIMNIQPTYRFGATGTPVQNTPQELWTMFHFINPDVLGDFHDFLSQYVVSAVKFNKYSIVGFKNLDELREKISPYILRRMKKDVATQLPKLLEINKIVEMNDPQRELYESLLSKQEELKQQEEQILKQYSNLSSSKLNEIQSYVNVDNALKGMRYLLTAASDFPLMITMGQSNMAKQFAKLAQKAPKSAKLETTMELIKELLENDHRVLIFSQFTRMLDILNQRIREELKQEPYQIDGRVSQEQRSLRINEAKESTGERDVMLISDAGNYGLNLAFFDRLINYDHPWNPTVSEQRAGRIHRISGGVSDSVTVLNMITKETIDESIIATQNRKKEISSAII